MDVAKVAYGETLATTSPLPRSHDPLPMVRARCRRSVADHEDRADHRGAAGTIPRRPLQLLETVAGHRLVEDSYAAAIEQGDRWHEFGDVRLILPR